MMVDDVLYLRRDASGEWKPMAEDAAFAHPDLTGLPASIKAKIRNMPLDKKGIETLKRWDERKEAAGEAAFAEEFAALRETLSAALRKADAPGAADAYLAALKMTRSDAESAWRRAAASVPDQKITLWRFRPSRSWTPCSPADSSWTAPSGTHGWRPFRLRLRPREPTTTPGTAGRRTSC
jgi:hypothetical protein